MAEAVLTGVSAGVIGGGIFGVTAALELARAGAAVTLYEQRADILTGATARNFFRLHRGYHYPRDPVTAGQSRDGCESFTRMFGEALTPAVPHYYAIAAEGSLTSADQFARHCDEFGLPALPARPPFLAPGSVQECFEVGESYYDAGILRRLCRERLRRANVSVEMGCTLSPAAIGRAHDVVVVAAYAGLNEVLAGLGCPPMDLQYETCEVAVIEAPRLPPASLVVMDGPFMSVAPYGRGLHILYDVEHSVHTRATGDRLPASALASRTRFAAMLASARRFVTGLEDARQVGSLQSVRVVLPGVDTTDARPTQVTWMSDRVLSVLSGKVCTSVDAAALVAAEVASKLAGRCDEPATTAAVRT